MSTFLRGSQPRRTAAFLVACVGLLCAVVTAGCSRHFEDKWSRQWPARVPAGGTVTFEGRPIDGATVVFVTSREGRFYNAIGQTDSTGRFVLQTFRPRDGAVPGMHKVQIEKHTFSEKPADLPAHANFTPVETSHLPKKYRNPETSGLTAEVSEKGPNEFTFSIE